MKRNVILSLVFLLIGITFLASTSANAIVNDGGNITLGSGIFWNTFAYDQVISTNATGYGNISTISESNPPLAVYSLAKRVAGVEIANTNLNRSYGNVSGVSFDYLGIGTFAVNITYLYNDGTNLTNTTDFNSSATSYTTEYISNPDQSKNVQKIMVYPTGSDFNSTNIHGIIFNSTDITPNFNFTFNDNYDYGVESKWYNLSATNITVFYRPSGQTSYIRINSSNYGYNNFGYVDNVTLLFHGNFATTVSINVTFVYADGTNSSNSTGFSNSTSASYEKVSVLNTVPNKNVTNIIIKPSTTNTPSTSVANITINGLKNYYGKFTFNIFSPNTSIYYYGLKSEGFARILFNVSAYLFGNVSQLDTVLISNGTAGINYTSPSWINVSDGNKTYILWANSSDGFSASTTINVSTTLTDFITWNSNLNDFLKVYFKFDSNTSEFNLADPNFNGTYVNGSNSVSGIINNGSFFNNAILNQYILTNISFPKGNTNMSFSLWFNGSTKGGTNSLFSIGCINSLICSSVRGVRLSVVWNNSTNNGLAIGNVNPDIFSGINPSQAVFHHLVVTYQDNGNIKMYLDRVKIIDKDKLFLNLGSDLPVDKTVLTIGNSTFTNAKNWNGTIDEFAGWSGKVLTEAEINQLYNSGLASNFTDYPSITINSPKSVTVLNYSNNITTLVNILFNISTQSLSPLYSLYISDGSNNISYSTPYSINLSNGNYSYIVFANTTDGLYSTKLINFTVNIANNQLWNSILSKNLSVYFRFDSNTTNEFNYANPNLNGTRVNSTYTTTGILNNATAFNSINVSMITTNISFPKGNTNMSFSLWFNLSADVSSTANRHMSLFTIGYVGSLNNYSGINLFLESSNSSNLNSNGIGMRAKQTPFYEYPTPITKNYFHHVVVTYQDNGKLRLYLDNLLIMQTNVTIIFNDTSLIIGTINSKSGASAVDFSTNSSVSIDEFAGWSGKVLTENEINQLYNSGFAMPFNESLDIIDPSALTNAPQNNSYFNSVVNFSVNASDNVNLSEFNLYIYNQSDIINQTNLSLSGNETNISLSVILINGIYNWFYKISDTSGNLFTSITNMFTVDSVQPSIYLISPTPNNNSIVSNEVEIYVNVSDTNFKNISYILSNSSSNFRFDSNTTQNNYNFTSLADGTYYFSVEANDLAGNYNTTEIITVSSGIFSPTIEIDSPLNQSYGSKNVFINITSDGTVWYDYGTGNITYTSPITVSLSYGSHTLIAYANNSQGNINSTSVTFQLLDTTPPTVSSYSPSGSSYFNTNTTNFSVNASDDNDLSQINLYVSNISGIVAQINTSVTGNTTITSSTVSNLIDGLYTFFFRIIDTAGNFLDTFTNMFTIDTIKPFLDIKSPLDNYYNSINSINFSVNEINIDTCHFTNSSGTIVISCFNNYSTIANEGFNSWSIDANDSAGNFNKKQVNFTIDSINPNIEFISPTPNNNSIIGFDFFTVAVLINETNLKNLSFVLENSSTQFRSDFNNSVSVNYTSLVSGQYIFYVEANDLAGNLNQTEHRTITVNTTLPIITINSPSPILYHVSNILVNITSNGQVTIFNNGSQNTTYTSPVFKQFGNGTHTLIVYSNNTVGLISSVNVTFIVNTTVISVNTTMPTLQVISPEDINYTETSIPIIVNSSGDNIYYTDGTNNFTYSGQTNKLFSEGYYTLTFFANNTYSDYNSTSVNFQIILPVVVQTQDNLGSILMSAGSGFSVVIQVLSSTLPFFLLLLGIIGAIVLVILSISALIKRFGNIKTAFKG